MLKNKRLLLIPLLLLVLATVTLGMKVAYPHHRLLAFVLIGLAWIPLVISYRINQRLLRIGRKKVKRKIRPFMPHAVVAVLLLAAFYLTATLFPVTRSPLVELSPEQLQEGMESDRDSLLMLIESADDLIAEFESKKWLDKSVESLTPEDRRQLRALWADGVNIFLEFDLLKEKYRGFYQIDYVARPSQHADAFMLAALAYTAQYNACMQVLELMGDNAFMETLLNEPGPSMPKGSCTHMKLRLTHPNVLLRLNAATAYFELVKKDLSLNTELADRFRARRDALRNGYGTNAELLIENPLRILEQAAFDAIFPVQKTVAVQMSHIRTARRDYLITPDILKKYREQLNPGDILIQRRNWHMTNIGIPGFWPHVALYVGTPDEARAFFGESGDEFLTQVQQTFPELYRSWNAANEDGFEMAVIESIRPGVVLQSLETSARCDYLAVLRPNRPKADIRDALWSAFTHYGKPYDLNFDFTTDNSLVCSELVYKAYRDAALPLEPEVISGRRLLPPNKLAEQAVEALGPKRDFSFVLFLDAVEKSDEIVARDAEAFRRSWQRPKWDVLQE